ncbi:heterokaryon incompatibility protein [Colletotrichum graminicola M1.001]|uniref:Heterokaryon incompatibility protein n=1 Tax=Colletotrichum graminicola (strain M1.001 / M2 / FGSC 10212) TaxID=645133 RepID=E3QZ59_COLGM|nr:heterokaryon incompatibility protein [Colletotrichum graminicola M1.001]EFQ36147.1 heterokaryon incompatibility protein [Colletotrichum graminicola M1.001]
MNQMVKFIRSCVDTCDSEHALCKQPTLRMPARVLDVGRMDDNQVQLVDTASMMVSPYVALSYCWGESNHLLTTEKNFQDMTTGIYVAEFPQTIRDAVEVTRRLNLKYLWVDAICIIQDSALDWEVESAKMASVYHNAYLTIAAGTSACASEGFLDQQHLSASHETPFRMKWRTDRGETSILAVRAVPARHTHSINLAGDRQNSLPLNTRGWSLQEELLSRRTITYTQNELWWTCQTQRDCECHAFDEITRDGPKALMSPTLMTTHSAAFEQWQAVVSEFSTRKLSYELDKLPALSGLASVVQKKTGSSYVAGLWKDNFVRDLNWYSPARTLDKLEDAKAKATGAYCAPTFSWASANGLIGFFKGSFAVSQTGVVPTTEWVARCTLIAANTVVGGSNPLGRVESGYATLRGHLSEALLGVSTACPSGMESHTLRYHGEWVRFHPDMQLEEVQLTAAGSKGAPAVSMRRSPAGSRAQTLRSESPVLLFYLGDWGFPDQEIIRIQRTYLVLGRSPLDTSQYERLGLAHHEPRFELNKTAQGCEGWVETITLW